MMTNFSLNIHPSQAENEPNKSRVQQMIEKLKEKGFRLTPQRLAIVKILAESSEHPGAEHIYAKVRKNFPTTSLATIYKTVTVLKEMGEVIEIGFGEGCSRFDGRDPKPHPHLICTKCKKIIDPDLSSLEQMSRELADETGYEIQSHRLDFFGICPKCQQL